MAVTVRNVAEYITASVDAASDLGIPLIQQWVVRRYEEMVGARNFRHLRVRGQLYATGAYNTGTVAATQGSNTLTGTATAWTIQYIGWEIRLATAWYTITDVPSATQIILSTNYAETTTTGSGYYAVQRFVPLPSTIRHINYVSHPRLFRRLRNKSLQWLDASQPSRILVAPTPCYWAEGPVYNGNQLGSAADQRTIEIYPPSTQAELYVYQGWNSPQLTVNSTLPQGIDLYVLADGAKVDVYEHLANRAMQQMPPDSTKAQFYSQMVATQRTLWMSRWGDALTQDHGSMDAEIELLGSYRWAPDVPGEYDQYVSRYPIITVQ